MNRFCGFLLVVFASFASAHAEPLKTVSFVDLQRYQGTWYEIAKIPNWFQRVCERNTTAQYKALPSGEIQVINSCVESSGDVNQILGRARVADPGANSKLRVAFFQFLGQWNFLFAGDYWVIDLDSNYRWAVVGAPNRNYGWILSRQSKLSVRTLRQIAARLTENGYDTCRFETTLQKNGSEKVLPLCDL